MTLSAAASSGDRVDTLRELRDLLARQIESCESGRDVAALSRQLTTVLAEISELLPSEKVDAVDEISARRNSRRAGAAPSAARAKRPG
jgi:hypothetical protein